MEEIIRFVVLANSDRFTLTDLCEQFGISRKTAYKHLARYEADGLKGLQARSHRPLRFPQRTDADVETLIVAESPTPTPRFVRSRDRRPTKWAAQRNR